LSLSGDLTEAPPRMDAFCCNVTCNAAGPLTRCVRCKRRWYCSKECQKQAWTLGHKRVCASSVPSQAVFFQRIETAEHNHKTMCDVIRAVDHLTEQADYAGIVGLTTSILSAADVCFALDHAHSGVMLYTKLAASLHMTGAYTFEIELLQVAIAFLDPMVANGVFFKVHMHLGLAYKAALQYTKARHCFQVACSHADHHLEDHFFKNEAQIAMAKCDFLAGDYACAVAMHEAVVETLLHHKQLAREQNPGEADYANIAILSALNRVAQCRMLLGQHDQAIACRLQVWYLLQDEPLQQNTRQTNYQMMTALSIGIDMAVSARVCSQHAETVDAQTQNEGSGAHDIYEAKSWLDTACKLAITHNSMDIKADCLLHLAFTVFHMGNQDIGRLHLRQHLELQLEIKHSWCRGCSSIASPKKHQLICCGCYVVGFCNKTCQMAASGKTKSCFEHSDIIACNPVRHKDICPLINQWRRVKKGKVCEDSCTVLHTEFLMGPAWYKARF